MTFEDVLEDKRRTRDAAIERLRDEAKSRGQMADRAFWSMIYDFEMAPMTTNRRQLGEIGVEVTASEELADDELAIKLREIVDALGRLSIYLLHTDHLSDRVLYQRLERDILDEEVRDLPADGVAREFIDLCMPETDEDWATYRELYEFRPEDGVRAASAAGELPGAPRRPPFDRDRTLPKPDGYAPP
ncbi:MAG: hypothetical protein SGJ09_00710 [Phycisphaerae bacterium]|nr:hypothetical protein [Phycisphaerae bacterium]